MYDEGQVVKFAERVTCQGPCHVATRWNLIRFVERDRVPSFVGSLFITIFLRERPSQLLRTLLVRNAYNPQLDMVSRKSQWQRNSHITCKIREDLRSARFLSPPLIILLDTEERKKKNSGKMHINIPHMHTLYR